MLDYVRKYPDATDLFSDKGSADAPAAYLIAVEIGLRTFAQNESTAFGKYAMDSRKEWVCVPMWKKCEAYIAVCRFLLDLCEYLKYINYDWADYISRRHMRQTFLTRHEPYSNGSKTLEGLNDPACWANASSSRRRRPHVTRKRKSKKHASPKEKSESANSAATKQWDSEEEAWVSLGEDS